MLKSYLEVALRHLVTHKLYSAINILGLAIGVACFILIALFVRHELSYDRQFARADRIYRVSRDFFADGVELHLAANAPQAAPLLKQDFPQIEQAGRLFCCGSLILSRQNAHFLTQATMADTELLEIFDFRWLEGDPRNALAEPFTIVLTERAADRYFGRENPLGRLLTIENRWPVKVTGVVADLPANTHLQFEVLLSLATGPAALDPDFLRNWGGNNFHTYVLLKPGARIDEIQRQSGEFFERHLGEGASRTTGYTAYALTDIHLKSNREDEISPPGSMTVVYTFSAIAVLVLLIACINFMNLATARSAHRAKEVGMRKVIGARREQLIGQFLGEALLVAFIAVLLAVAIVEVSLPFFNSFIQQKLTFDYLEDPKVGLLLVLLALFVGLLAGSYPAFYLSAFNPARVLKGDLTRGAAAATQRKVLVVLQFAISIGLVIATTIVYQQLQFTRGKELGYRKDLVVVLNGSATGGLGEQWDALRQQLLAHPQIAGVAASSSVPGFSMTNSIKVRAEGNDPEGRALTYLSVDESFFETYEMNILAGRGFSREFGADRLTVPGDDNPKTTAGYVLSEAAARQFGWTPDEAVGKWFEIAFESGFTHSARGPIVGVVKDAHFESLHSAIKPIVYFLPPKELFGFPSMRRASIRVSGEDLQGTLAYIDREWAKFLPGIPLARRFLEDDLEALYASEQRQGRVFSYFVILAIFIACLGLFGLASFTTEQRTKEIGVRKVLGASVWDVTRLFTTEFTKLVLIANLIAWPVAWWLMNGWLANFAYRVDMSPLVYVMGATLALVVAWLTVGGVAARAAGAKPILALRYE